MRVLVAPQEFKGTLTARQAADAIANGLRSVLPGLEIETLPLADGGPGTVDVLVHATGGRYIETAARDPLGRSIRSRWGLLGGPQAPAAIIEMAAASGLNLLQPDELDPRITSSHGAGDLILAALDAGCNEIIVGVGGSATNDGGAGMAQALGARLLDRSESELPPGGAALLRLGRIAASGLDTRVETTSFVVATDVKNPLCGPAGASLVYGPQKGASVETARQLDGALRHYAEIVARDLQIEVTDVPGSGAAGGLGAGLIAFCQATVRSGFDVVADAVDLVRCISSADVVITGEGRIDRQTPFGKTPAGVASLCRTLGIPVIAVAGQVDDSAPADLFDATFQLSSIASLPGLSEKPARGLLERLAQERVASWIQQQT